MNIAHRKRGQVKCFSEISKGLQSITYNLFTFKPKLKEMSSLGFVTCRRTIERKSTAHGQRFHESNRNTNSARPTSLQTVSETISIQQRTRQNAIFFTTVEGSTAETFSFPLNITVFHVFSTTHRPNSKTQTEEDH